MTSSSRRKPRTTRRNTPSRSELRRGSAAPCRRLAAGLTLLAGIGTWAGGALAEEWRTFLKAPEALLCAVAPVVAETEVVEAAAEDEDEPVGKEPCAEESGDCREALERLRKDKLDGIELDIRVGGRPGNDYPCECRLEGETFEPRRFATTMFTWKAPGYCHKPLYFEDWELERYGHSYGPLDPVLSAAHFFTTLPVLPYKMGVELPWECVYPLGYYRPGDCAPWTIPAIPISFRGMAVEAATVTGLVFLLP
jgi:hypothetical protein